VGHKPLLSSIPKIFKKKLYDLELLGMGWILIFIVTSLTLSMMRL